MQHFWENCIRPLLESIDARRIVEIGVGDGGDTKNLLSYAEPMDGHIDAIDPDACCDIEQWTSPALHYHKDLSLNVLGTLADYDAVLIDGDHNWYTVYHELLMIGQTAKKMGKFPLIMLHDVGWPYARRDLYYSPETIPPAFRQPFERKGLLPDSHGLSDDASFNEGCNNSIYEHAIKNGVLTAVEDFLGETDEKIRFVQIPGWHGLGILASEVLISDHPRLHLLLDDLSLTTNIAAHIKSLEYARISEINMIGAMEKTMTLLGSRADNLQRTLQEAQQKEQLMLEQTRLKEQEAQLQEQLMLEQQKRERAEMEAIKAEAAVQTEYARLEIIKATKSTATAQRERLEMQQNWESAKKDVVELYHALEHMQKTRSWRYTGWLRWIEHVIRHPLSSKKMFGVFKRLWVFFGEPFPAAARYTRHQLLGHMAPVASQNVTVAPVASHVTESRTETVAVVIPCHNYGEFLADAIDGVLAQTVQPQEIIVVDDASDDDTSATALSYKERGVQYIRGEWLSVGAARNAGLKATSADFLIFLDADDVLHPTYVRSMLDAFAQHPEAGIAYSNQQYFGESKLTYDAPDTLDWKRFDEKNHINSAAMVRRTALLQAGSFSHGVDQDGDWVTWRRILRLGWNAVKADTVFYHRVHGNNMTSALQSGTPYAVRAGFLDEAATFCIPLSGRSWAWPATARFLEEQTFPHHLLHLIILDTSQDPAFSEMVKSWISQCDYPGVTYLQEAVGPKGLADLPRAEVQDLLREACARIYNRFARLTNTTLTFFLEDDVLPPTDAYVRLASHFSEGVISVSGLYQHRESTNPVAWEWKNAEEPPEFAEVKQGVTKVGGTGFGCIAMRGECLRRTVFHAGPPYRNYDHNFYHQAVVRDGMTALIDWDCHCEHRSSPSS